MSAEDDRKRWALAAHAMQTGVATEMSINPGPTEPKHLRVGVNAAYRDLGSLCALLIAKGVMTEEEYYKAIADGMEQEVRDYEARLSEALGRTVKLY